MTIMESDIAISSRLTKFPIAYFDAGYAPRKMKCLFKTLAVSFPVMTWSFSVRSEGCAGQTFLFVSLFTLSQHFLKSFLISENSFLWLSDMFLFVM